MASLSLGWEDAKRLVQAFQSSPWVGTSIGILTPYGKKKGTLAQAGTVSEMDMQAMSMRRNVYKNWKVTRRLDLLRSLEKNKFRYPPVRVKQFLKARMTKWPEFKHKPESIDSFKRSRRYYHKLWWRTNPRWRKTVKLRVKNWHRREQSIRAAWRHK